MPSDTPTPWAVHCHDGCTPAIVYLTRAEYDFQMGRPNRTWMCPRCGGDAGWDDDNYEKAIESMEAAGDGNDT